MSPLTSLISSSFSADDNAMVSLLLLVKQIVLLSYYTYQIRQNFGNSDLLGYLLGKRLTGIIPKIRANIVLSLANTQGLEVYPFGDLGLRH